MIKTKYNGIYVLENISKDEAVNVAGQGVYIWTFADQNGNFFEPREYKVGQYGSLGSDKLPQETVASYVGVTNFRVVVVYAKRLDNYLKESKNYNVALDVEKAIHNKIIKMGGWRVEDVRGTEFFGGKTLDELKEIVNEVLYGIDRKNDFAMRYSQQQAHDKMVKYFSNNGEKFLLAAKMRFGKNYVLLNVVKTMDFKNVLVMTYKPYVYDSLIDDISNHVDFVNFDIVDYKDIRKYKPNSNRNTICLCSAQLALNKTSDGEEIDERVSINNMSRAMKDLTKIGWDMVAIDEYHYGTSTFNFNTILKSLKYKHLTYMSGTPFKDLALGTFSEEEYFTWTYIDEQKEKVKDKEKGFGSYITMPTIKMFGIDITSDSKLAQAYYTEEDQLRMEKIISIDNDKLKDEGSLELLLKAIKGKYGHKKLSPYATVSGLEHTFWVLPKNTKGIVEMAKLMRRMPEYEGYDVIAATGNETTQITEVKQRIAKAKSEGKGTITLSCYRFKEGVSIPEWNGVFFLDGGSSPEEYIQAMFRCQSPNSKENKDLAYVFDFNPNRMLSMTYRICENMDARYKTDVVDIIREYMDYCPILTYAENGWKEIDPQRVIEQFRISTSMRDRLQALYIDVDKIDETTIEAISGLKAGYGGTKKDIEINIDDEVKTGKISKERREISNEEAAAANKKLIEKDLAKYRERIKTALSMIPVFMFMTPTNERIWEDIATTEYPDLFKEIVGVYPEEMNEWLVKEIIVGGVPNFNRTLMFVADSIQELEDDFTSENYDNFVTKHFAGLKGVNVKTPLVIIDRMIKMCKIDFTNANQKILDPCCGTVSYLLRLKELFMKGLEEVIIDEAEREKHIVDNMLFGLDIDENKIKIARKILKSYNNLRVGDALKLAKEEIFLDMKFDLIISNPPYNHNLDLKIMKEIYELSDKFCFVHPAGWLYDKSNNKLYDSVKDMFSNDFADYEMINVDEGNKLFGIEVSHNIILDLFEKGNNNHDIFGIDMHGNSEIFQRINEKIVEYCRNKNNLDVAHKEYKASKFDVGFHHYRGNKGTPDINTVLELRDPTKHDLNTNKYNYTFRFAFDTRKEQENFLNYLRSKMFRFCVSLKKLHQHFYSYHIEVIPYLPTYKHSWKDEMIAEEIGLTHEEMVWMINWIPDYYPGDKEKYEKYFDPNQKDRQLLGTEYTYGGYKA